jgi:hypothetical protein
MSVRETIKEAYERLHRMETDEIVDYAYHLEQELSIEREKLKKIEKYIDSIEFFEATHFDENFDEDIYEFNNESEKARQKLKKIIEGYKNDEIY